ncbi:Tim44/TimA family putative adaptor protein [Lichenibacterium dinghuense]|uniref:Tim44/TimA family putative adaptor protein n=1 Tax=Lichenibacterium dinghuense TaxID=2895977 RepID=UPI001F4911FC|nr:Tim44/TimA family putative adaptor protein [Lichenibacterium sp. 6Y81]
MHQSFDPSIVIFAVLAIFVVWKLRSVLGTRTGNERPPFDPFEARRKLREGKSGRDAAKPEPGRGPGQVIPLQRGESRAVEPAAVDPAAAWRDHVEPGSRALDGLSRIAEADRSFEPNSFMQGARGAYEIIVTGFAAGDRAALKPLLAKDVYEGFNAAISAREERGEKNETTFVSTERSLVHDAQLRGRTAQVTIRFQSKMITVTRGRDGAVVEGAPDQVADVFDLWTFARETDARDPNWRLVATEAGA